ncbi:MAG: glycine-rich domain-containing protein [Ferruginibacter sp.]
MKYLLLFILAPCVLQNAFSQNVGIGTVSPSEKLDVNGNINLNGQLKVNTNGGNANQVLMKDMSNNLAWGDLSEYKNMVSFECYNTTTVTGNSNCNTSWLVPAGVTSILVECWGGGGGGSYGTGGNSGGYISGKIPVTPQSFTSLLFGAGGAKSQNNSTNGILGGNTSFSYGTIVLGAPGGYGGDYHDPFTTTSTIFTPSPGVFTISGVTDNYYILLNNSGKISKLTYVQASSTDFAKQVDYGDGGDAPLFPGSGCKGGYRIAAASLISNFNAQGFANHFAAGGGADFSGGTNGRGGRIIIHW